MINSITSRITVVFFSGKLITSIILLTTVSIYHEKKRYVITFRISLKVHLHAKYSGNLRFQGYNGRTVVTPCRKIEGVLDPGYATGDNEGHEIGAAGIQRTNLIPGKNQ